MKTPSIQKILIANRGEIAIRIARTCKKLGIATVGMFSEQDRHSLHLSFCDEAYSLGHGSIQETYLNIEKIIAILARSHAQAVHPGYGFLSERPLFVEAVQAIGGIFIGPSAESMRVMGSKLESKQWVKQRGVPLLPGTEEGVRDWKQARQEALRIGYPVLLKASAGGGGKGMRIVHSENELQKALESAAREAQNYFGDGTVYIEKYLENPHHIEVQVLGDGRGGGGHVFDRECSIQRRHQKLLEESPAPLLMRHSKSKQKILDLANQIVTEMKYASAGTLEFLGDDEGNFYFLEMNTRLQVEHPVTELVTGMDLVEKQILIAEGERLANGAQAQRQNGHAIEARIYAETPFEYLPTGGKVLDIHFPSGPFVRVDAAVDRGYEVPIEYDPTLMKLCVWGENRKDAVLRLRQAVDELRILGVQSNQGLFWSILREPEFIQGMYGTPYLEKNRAVLKSLFDAEVQRLRGVLMNAVDQMMDQSSIRSDAKKIVTSPWELQARRDFMKV